MRRALSSWAGRRIELLSFIPRPMRRRLVFVLDGLCCLLSVYCAFSLRLDQWSPVTQGMIAFAVIAFSCWIILARVAGVYRNLVRYSGGKAIAGVGYACAWMVPPLALLFSIARLWDVPKTMALLQPVTFFLLLVFCRSAIRVLLTDIVTIISVERPARRRIAIYGAGRAGRQLAASLRHEPAVLIAGFLDDDARIDRQRIDGITVWHPARIGELVDDGVAEVLLAIPSVSRARRREIVAALQQRSIRVKMLPGIGQLVEGDLTFDDLREVQVEDLLGRDPVSPNLLLMGRALVGKTVLVSGAGGSIGTELCRQILSSQPARLILAEQSEFALYAIDAELRDRIAAEGLATEIVAELIDVSERGPVDRLFGRWRPDTVYHAAAYKHVPIVEANPVAGLSNNIFGTLNCVLAAETAGVQRFILVSTDKAVRPTNVMGASKRVCELILQARADDGAQTLFTMVRFGNVLGSSGSVVPRFKEQIRAGGPITITHRDITRYFMTIPEAAQLVIQAGGMARGGDVFVLDMGQPVRICDLAETMVRLSGLSVRDESCPDGDIEIVEVGLRPGEKLYEELLIGENPVPTVHPRIMKAHEAMVPWPVLARELDRIERDLHTGGSGRAMTIVQRLVPEYRARPLQSAASS